MQVCSNCFNDIEIRSQIDSLSSETGNCKYCKSTSVKLIDVSELLDFFVEFFDVFEEDSTGIPLAEILNHDWNLFSTNAVADILVKDLLILIDHHIKTPTTKVKYISEIIDNVGYWETLKNDLKWERRFIQEIDTIKDLGWDAYFNEFVTFTDKEIFYRARIHFNEKEATFPIDEMGCPPKEFVSNGRANPQGIPYLYLSKSSKTTFYETRALFNDLVSVGEFKIKSGESINIVDFTEQASAFMGIGDLVNYTKKILLKKQISKDLSKPIRRYDTEIEYIPTQFICEFIKHIIGFEGILFNSSLDTEGKNIVLFDQSKIECIDVKKYIITKLELDFEPVKP